MDTCTGGTGIPWDCKALTLQDTDAMNSCRQAEKVPEVAENQCSYIKHSLYIVLANTLPDLEALPGCNPIQSGPASATMVPNCAAPSTTINAPAPTAPPAVATPPWPVCNAGPGAPASPIVPNCADFPGAKEPQITPPPA